MFKLRPKLWGVWLCCYTRSPLCFSCVCVSVLLWSVCCARPGQACQTRHFDFLFGGWFDTKEQRKHEWCVHHLCNYEALCCIRPGGGRNLDPTETEAEQRHWKGDDDDDDDGGGHLKKKKIHRDALTSFYVYNRLCDVSYIRNWTQHKTPFFFSVQQPMVAVATATSLQPFPSFFSFTWIFYSLSSSIN